MTDDPNKKPGPGRPPGRPRGRPKGKPNKKLSESLFDRIKQKFPNYDPVIKMIEIALDDCNSKELRFNANKEVAQYIYPKKKAVEHKTEDGSAPFQIIIKRYEDMDIKQPDDRDTKQLES